MARSFDPKKTQVEWGSPLRKGEACFGGRFVLERELGQGGMGVVWLARDTMLDGELRALKFVSGVVAKDAMSLARLKAEARAGMGLRHPRIVAVHDFHSDGDLAAVAMEFLEGESLSDLLAKKVTEGPGFFEVEEIWEWVGQVVEALDYAHREAKMMHRDLKPGNIMVERSTGVAKVLDFGIARRIAETHTRLTGKDEGFSLSYSSPQQILGERAQVSDDVYALGSTIFELLTGSPVFHTGDVKLQVQQKSPPTMAERRQEMMEDGFSTALGEVIPEEWEELVAACLAKKAEERPKGMAGVSEVLSGRGAESRRQMDEERRMDEDAPARRRREEAAKEEERMRRAREVAREAEYRRKQED